MPNAINSKKLVRIWFSSNPNEFLGLENELSMIRLVEKNPRAKISLLYSRKCLSTNGKSLQTLVNLAKFCKKHKITPIDFDTLIDLKSPNVDPHDKEKFQDAQEQIDLKLSNQGGSFAAASDFARTIVPVLEIGNYCDFDTEVEFNSLPELVPVKESLIFPAQTNPDGSMVTNSDFLAASVDPKNKDKLSEEAIKRIRLLQNKLSQNKKLSKEVLLSTGPGSMFIATPEGIRDKVIDSFLTKNQDKSISAFRVFVESIDVRHYYSLLASFVPEYPPADKLSDKECARRLGVYLYKNVLEIPQPPIHKVNLEGMAQRHVNTFKNDLLIRSVITTSGATPNFYYLFSDIKGKGKNRELNKGMEMCERTLACGLKANNLDKCVKDQESKPLKLYSFIASLTGKKAYPMVGELNDASWTPLGKLKKDEREQKIRSTGIKFLYEFKRRKKKGTLGKHAQELVQKMKGLKMGAEEKKEELAYDRFGKRT